MNLLTEERLRRIRVVGTRSLAYIGLQEWGRRHLDRPYRWIRSKEERYRHETHHPPTPWVERMERMREPGEAGVEAPTVLVVNDCSDQDNLGTDALMDGLRDILLESVPTATFRSIPSHWVMDSSVFGSAFRDGGKGLSQPTPVFPEVADQFEEIADEWLDGKAGPDAMEFLARFDRVDLVVLNGEGSIYRTNPSAVRELFLVWLAKTRLGIPTIFVNGTVHLTDVVPILPAMVRKALGALDAVAVREPFSLRNLRAYAPDIPVRSIPDSAFVHGADAARLTDSVRAVQERLGGRDFFCYDPGPMAIDGRSPRRSAQFSLISGLKEIVSEAVLVATPPVLPHVKVLPRLAEETDAIFAGTLRDYREYMALIRDARFVVTGRYHDTIFAASMGCPTVALASASHKVHGICELLDGMVGMPFDGTDLRSNLDAIKEQAAHYVSVADTLRPALRAKAQELGTGAWEIGELVKAALGLEIRQI